jgi:hypothetical protein
VIHFAAASCPAWGLHCTIRKIITTKALKMISRIFGVFSILSSASSSSFDLTQGLANVNNDPRDTWIRSQRSFYPRVCV